MGEVALACWVCGAVNLGMLLAVQILSDLHNNKLLVKGE
jgi:hypothetical protein